jgi:D-sedoheptulose 7-phosphate isomerase
MKNLTGNISGYLSKLKSTIDKLNIDEINTFINLLLDARESGKQIFIMGNGGSGATASHFCCDFNKGASYEVKNEKRFKFICLNDNVATMLAYTNDVGYDEVFVEQLKNFYNQGDVVIGISGSGNSMNVLRAIEYANAHEGVTIGITGYSGGKLKSLAKYSVHVNIDDMQIAEDLHMVLDHLSMQVIVADGVSSI